MYTHARKYSHTIPLSVAIHMHSYCFWLPSVMSDFCMLSCFHSLLFLPSTSSISFAFICLIFPFQYASSIFLCVCVYIYALVFFSIRFPFIISIKFESFIFLPSAPAIIYSPKFISLLYYIKQMTWQTK